jgi:hypothetical protein
LLDLAILRSAGQPGHDDWVVWVGAFSAAETALVIEQGITIGGKRSKTIWHAPTTTGKSP